MPTCHSKSRSYKQGGLFGRPVAGDSVPAIPHPRAVKMPLWKSKRKIKDRPEQGIALSEVTTFIVTFVLHSLVHHRVVFFIPLFPFFLCLFFFFFYDVQQSIFFFSSYLMDFPLVVSVLLFPEIQLRATLFSPAKVASRTSSLCHGMISR